LAVTIERPPIAEAHPHMTILARYRTYLLVSYADILGIIAAICLFENEIARAVDAVAVMILVVVAIGLPVYGFFALRCPLCGHRVWGTGPPRWCWYGKMPPEHCAFCGEKLE
jgi:hypothetical protein